jgi:transposase-like protein
MPAPHRDPVHERLWRQRIADQQASGLSVRDYCQQHALAQTTFYFWRLELRRRDQHAQTTRPAFVPVTVVASPTATVEVHCPSGHRVTITALDTTGLRELFAALTEATAC